MCPYAQSNIFTMYDKLEYRILCWSDLLSVRSALGEKEVADLVICARLSNAGWTRGVVG